MLRELKMLERRCRAGGKVVVDHPDGQHDDVVNSLAIAAAAAITDESITFLSWMSGGFNSPTRTHCGRPSLLETALSEITLPSRPASRNTAAADSH